VTLEATVERIDAPAADVAYLLSEEAQLGRVRRTDAGTWQLVPRAFPAGTVEALRAL
jgi:hypothetical protein